MTVPLISLSDVEALYNGEFCWNAVVDKNIVNEQTDKISIPLTPKALYNIFDDYVTGEMDQNVSIIFPKSYGTNDSELMITIKTSFPLWRRIP